MARVIQMSDRELTRLRVMIDLADDRLTVDAAAILMGLGRRQIYRLRRVFSADGPAGLASRKRGRPSNRKRGESFRATVLSLVREHYVDFGPTLAAEKLIARHGLRLGVETLRQWMMAEGLWVDRRHKLPSPHQPRRRRECLGELVQIDGSEHRWFEDRGEMSTRFASASARADRRDMTQATKASPPSDPPGRCPVCSGWFFWQRSGNAAWSCWGCQPGPTTWQSDMAVSVFNTHGRG